MVKQSDMQVMQFPSKYIQGKCATALLPEIMDQIGGNNLILAIDRQKPKMEDLMGDKARIEVFGCLVELELFDPMGIRDKTYEFFANVGLPITLADMQMPDATDEQVRMMAEDVAKDDPTQYSHHEPYEFDADMVFNAIRAVDARGRAYRAR